MDKMVSQYLAEIGRKGGKKSRCKLTPEPARNMVKIGDARRAFRSFYASWFWSFDPSNQITARDLPWVATQLKTYRGRRGLLGDRTQPVPLTKVQTTIARLLAKNRTPEQKPSSQLGHQVSSVACITRSQRNTLSVPLKEEARTLYLTMVGPVAYCRRLDNLQTQT